MFQKFFGLFIYATTFFIRLFILANNKRTLRILQIFKFSTANLLLICKVRPDQRRCSTENYRYS